MGDGEDPEMCDLLDGDDILGLSLLEEFKVMLMGPWWLRRH